MPVNYGDTGNVAAGLAAQPLVSPMQPVASPDAVSQLVSGFRAGQINSLDILDRVGATANANKKALLQQLGEYVSPDAISARMNALRGQGAQAQVATGVAQTQLAQLPQQAAISGTALNQQQAEQIYGAQALHSYDQYRGLYNLPPAVLPDGTPDFKTKGMLGGFMLGDMAQRNYARELLVPDPTLSKENVLGGGVSGTIERNKMGIETTAGSASGDALRKLVFSPFQVPGGPPGQTPAGIVPPSGEPAALVSPSNGSSTNPPPAPNALVSPASGSSTNPPPAPVIQPAPGASPQVGQYLPGASPQVGQYIPGVGLIHTQADPAKVSSAVQDFLNKDKSYSSWSEQKQFALDFDKIAQQQIALGATDPKKWTIAASIQNPQNENDEHLAKTVAQMFNPGNTIRPTVIDKLTASTPAGELLQNAGQEILRTGSMSPSTRARVISMGYDTIDSKERSAAPAVSTALQQIPRGMGPDPKTGFPLGLNSDDVRILKGIPFRESTPRENKSPVTPSVGVVTRVEIPGRPPMVKDANGNYWPAAN